MVVGGAKGCSKYECTIQPIVHKLNITKIHSKHRSDL